MWTLVPFFYQDNQFLPENSTFQFYGLCVDVNKAEKSQASCCPCQGEFNSGCESPPSLQWGQHLWEQLCTMDLCRDHQQLNCIAEMKGLLQVLLKCGLFWNEMQSPIDNTHNRPFKMASERVQLQAEVVMAWGGQSIWLQISVELGVGAELDRNSSVKPDALLFSYQQGLHWLNHLFDTD